jgi:uncharacterized membrane protein
LLQKLSLQVAPRQRPIASLWKACLSIARSATNNPGWIVVPLLYPAVIWLGQTQLQPRLLAGFMAVVSLAQIPRLQGAQIGSWWRAGTLLLMAIAVWSNGLLSLKLYPVLVNGVLLGLFTHSLYTPPSIVERIARVREPDLEPAAICYTRRVTQVWCAFFAVNGGVAFATAIWASPAVWSLYNGLIAYILMGALFGGEYCIRCRFKRRRHG